MLRYIPVDQQPWLGPKRDWPKACRVTDCDLPRYNKRLCFRHDARVKSTGTTADPRSPHLSATCVIAYCERDADSRSLCKSHHQILMRGRLAVVADDSVHYCVEAACEQPVWTAGLCRLHSSRKRAGRTDLGAQRRVCMVSDCKETSVDRFRCSTHLAELEAAEPGRVVCTMPDCAKNVIARGLCSAHYYKARRAGTLDAHSPRGHVNVIANTEAPAKAEVV